MGPQLRRVGAVLKTFWWVIVLVVVAIFVGWIYLVNRKNKKKVEAAVSDEAPSLVQAVAHRVQGAVTDVKVETAVIKTKSAERRKELEEVRAEPDGKKRRERLAAILQDSL